MKKITLVLVCILLISSAACGDSPAADVTPPSSISTVSPDTVIKDTEPVETTHETTANTATPLPQNTASIDEIVLVDESDVKITAKSLEDDGLFGPEIKLLIENNSAQDLTVQCRNTAVNGYMVDSMFSVDVAAGKKANDTISFLRSKLDLSGIESIADIELSFHIFTMEDWETYLDTPQIQIKTSLADAYEYSFDDSGDVAYDENGIRVIVKGLNTSDSIMGPGIIVYIENNSSNDITVQTRNVSINGFMVDGFFSSDVLIGKHAVDTITFLTSDLEENEISKINSVELSFHIFDMDGWNTIADSDVISLTF